MSTLPDDHLERLEVLESDIAYVAYKNEFELMVEAEKQLNDIKGQEYRTYLERLIDRRLLVLIVRLLFFIIKRL